MTDHPEAMLVVERGVDDFSVIPLEQPECILGKSPSANIVLDNPYVSRRHALISQRHEHFEIEVRVTSSTGAPVEDAQVSARCNMPEHGHGMNVIPRGRELGQGLYRVEGMLLHMRGRWVLGIDVILDGLGETADFEILLE